MPMNNNYNNNYTIYNERNSNRNADYEAANKDPETVAVRKAREECYDMCGPYPTVPEGDIELSPNTQAKIKTWMDCYAECLKKHPYTALEKRLQGISGGKRNRRKTARRTKNRRSTRRN